MRIQICCSYPGQKESKTQWRVETTRKDFEKARIDLSLFDSYLIWYHGVREVGYRDITGQLVKYEFKKSDKHRLQDHAVKSFFDVIFSADRMAHLRVGNENKYFERVRRVVDFENSNGDWRLFPTPEHSVDPLKLIGGARHRTFQFQPGQASFLYVTDIGLPDVMPFSNTKSWSPPPRGKFSRPVSDDELSVEFLQLVALDESRSPVEQTDEQDSQPTNQDEDKGVTQPLQMVGDIRDILPGHEVLLRLRDQWISVRVFYEENRREAWDLLELLTYFTSVAEADRPAWSTKLKQQLGVRFVVDNVEGDLLDICQTQPDLVNAIVEKLSELPPRDAELQMSGHRPDLHLLQAIRNSDPQRFEGPEDYIVTIDEYLPPSDRAPLGSAKSKIEPDAP
jgi:hypothetical protein